jgi:hypothetical protein
MFKELCLLQSKIETSFLVCKLGIFFQLFIRGSSSIKISFGRISQFIHFQFLLHFHFDLIVPFPSKTFFTRNYWWDGKAILNIFHKGVYVIVF